MSQEKNEIPQRFPQDNKETIKIVAISDMEEQIPIWYFDHDRKSRIKRYFYDWWKWFFPHRSNGDNLNVKLIDVLVSPRRNDNYAFRDFVKKIGNK